MAISELQLPDGRGGTVSGRLAKAGSPLVILAHGAGSNQDHPGVSLLRDGLAGEGIAVLTFNYPYTEAGRKAPDSQPVLLGCHRAVIDWASARWDNPVLAGRSMGGRMASYLVAEGAAVKGLVCLAYPLHPPGRPDSLRADHLPTIKIPVLFVRGDRDTMSRTDLFDRHVRSLAAATILDVPGVGHGLPITATIVSGVALWVRSLVSGKA